ncbi:MAG: 6-bladed beta-propeller [Deltaproteobacteria bacterium]|nr:6-bladed beta-propeller [Deltaproteobacteria bacterium]
MSRFRNRVFVGFCLLLLGSCAPNVTEKPADLVWPVPPEQPRIRFVRSLCCLDDFGKSGRDAWLESLFGSSGTLRMSKPYGITTDKDGKVYVTDTGFRTVWIFDEKAKKITTLGGGALGTPIGVAVDAKGKAFVSDARGQRVHVFDATGKQVMVLGQKDEFGNPAGLAIDRSTNRLYVANSKLHKIRVYDTESGKFLFDIGGRGSDNGKLNFPTNIFVRNGRLYVTDTGNFRVQLFDLDGSFLKTFGKVGDTFGQFARPRGIGVDSEGHIYVADSAFDNFQIFNEEGKILLFVGSRGSDPGFFSIPSGLHIDDQDRIYVADQYNNRVQVFQYLSEKRRNPQAKVN